MERMHEIMKARLEADETLSRIEDTHRSLVKSLDEEMSIRGPVKIGDIVDVTGFSHVGKKMIIDSIWISIGDWNGAGVKAEGRVLKKDGTPGLNMADYFIKVGVAP